MHLHELEEHSAGGRQSTLRAGHWLRLLLTGLADLSVPFARALPSPGVLLFPLGGSCPKKMIHTKMQVIHHVLRPSQSLCSTKKTFNGTLGLLDGD